MTKSEDVAATLAVAVRSRVMRLWTLSRPMERNCDVILKAKMLLQACDSLMDELIQYFYYIAAYENGIATRYQILETVCSFVHSEFHNKCFTLVYRITVSLPITKSLIFLVSEIV